MLDAPPANRVILRAPQAEGEESTKSELKALVGKTSVPQAFCNGEHLGGCNDGGLGGVIPCIKA